MLSQLYIKLSTMVRENLEICLPQMARNEIEAIGNYGRLLQRQQYSEQKVRGRQQKCQEYRKIRPIIEMFGHFRTFWAKLLNFINFRTVWEPC